MLEMRLTIHGQVQGVGFRRSVLNFIESANLMIKGKVQNLANGTVELIACGNIEDLKELRHFVATGIDSAVVRDIEETVGQAVKDEFSEFSIEY